jgi:predicted deacetylase
MGGAVAVALHDVEPRSFRRCREIRTWLVEHGVERATLLVIPAADLHPIGARSPALSAWLRHRVALGDTVAQHGLAHRSTGRATWPGSIVARWQGGDAAEFPGLGPADTASRVSAGLRFLREIELDPRGFVAPGYAYTQALRDVLPEQFEWFAELRSVRTRDQGCLRAPALCLGASTPLKRMLSPAVVRATARSCGELMRIDVHPADFEFPRHVATLEALLDRAHGREVLTYDELGS